MTVSKVVKPFPYAADGFTVVKLIVGEERDFGDSTDGLVAAGVIERASDKSAAQDVPAAPEDDKPKRGRKPAVKQDDAAAEGDDVEDESKE